MKQYMLLLHESTTGMADLSADAIEQIIADYVAWSNKLGEAGRLAGGEKLREDGGRFLEGSGDDLRVTDGPFAESKEIIGGYFTILADDYDDAVSLASDCPHLTYGGRIELREVEPTE